MPPDYLPPPGYRVPNQPYSARAGYGNPFLPAKVGPVASLLRGRGLAPPPANGLVMWLDGDSQAYADLAGTQYANPLLGQVARINQNAPALPGAWLTSNDTTQRAVRDSSSFDIQYGSLGYISQPAGMSVHAQNSTWGFSFQNRISPSGVSGLFYGTVLSANWGVTIQGTVVFTLGGNFYDSGIAIPCGAIVYGVIQFTSNAVSMTVVVNGVSYTYAATATTPNGQTQNVRIGSASGNAYHAQIAVSQILAYNTSAADTDSILAFLKGRINPGYPLSAPLVAVAGDSISQGVTATTGLSEFYQAQQNLVSVGLRMHQNGISGLNLAGLVSRYAAEIKPFYNSKRAKNILMVQCMTNSMPCLLAGAAANAAAVLSTYYGYCDVAKADGWIVVLFTCLPRADVTANTGFPTCWNLVNTDIRANYLAHGADLCDVSAVTGMSTIADAASGPNFSDQLHPNNAGQALLQPAVLAAINRRLAA